MNSRQIWLAKDTGCLAGGQGFCNAKMAEIQPSGGDECFLRGAHLRDAWRHLYFNRFCASRQGFFSLSFHASENGHERNCPCPYTIAPWRIAPNEWALPRQWGYHFFWDRLNRASMALTSSGRASLAAFEMLARPIMASADRPVRTRRSLAARSAMVMGVPLLRS